MTQPRRDRYRPPHRGIDRPVPAPRGPQPARGLFQVIPASFPEPEQSPEMTMGAISEAAQAASEEVQAVEVQAAIESMENAIRRARDSAIRRRMPQWTWENLEWVDADVVGSPGADDHQDFWDSLWDPGTYRVEG